MPKKEDNKKVDYIPFILIGIFVLIIVITFFLKGGLGPNDDKSDNLEWLDEDDY